jgi:hypothetical protein
VRHMEAERGPDPEARRAKQQALMADIRRQHPSASVSEGIHVEFLDGVPREIPIVHVELETGEVIVFFAERPEHPTAG